MTIFLSGYLLGVKKGIIIGLIAEFLYSMINPYGMAAPPLLLAQIISMGISGAAGGLVYATAHRNNKLWLRIIQFAIAGFVITLLFDALTTISISVFMAETKKKILAVTISSLIYGLPFYITHILANTLIFALGLPVMIKAIEKIDYFKPRLFGAALLLFMIFSNHSDSNAATLIFAAQDSGVQHLPEITVPDSVIKTDTLHVEQSDTSEMELLKKIPPKIIFEADTTQCIKQWDCAYEYPQSEIQQYIYNSLNEVLSYLPGFFNRDLSYPGQPAYINYRGLSSQYSSVFVDGRPIKDPHTNKTDLNVLPIESIRNLKIENELQSRFFENGLNISSERFSKEAPYTRIYFHKGPSEFSDVDVAFGQKVAQKMNTMTGLTLKGFSGPLPLQSNSLEQHTARLNYEYRYSPRSLIRYSLIYNRIKAHSVGAKQPSGEYATPDGRSLRLRFDHTLMLRQNVFNADFHNWITTLYFSTLSNKLKDKTFEIDNNYHYKYIGLNSVLYHQFGPHFLTGTANVEYTWADAADIGKQSRSTFLFGARDDYYFNNRAGIRGQADIKMASELGIAAETGAGLFFNITDRFKTTAGVLSTVRFPSLFEMYTREYITGNPDLIRETVHKAYMEIDLRPFDSLHLISQLYVKNVDDLMQYQFREDDTVTLINGEDDTYFGADIQVRGNVFRGMQFGSVASFVDMKNRFLEEVPRTMLYGYIQYENSFFENDLHVILRFDSRFWDKRWGIASYGYVFNPDYLVMPADAIINVNAFFEVGLAKFFIAMENILDRPYELIYGYPRNGRTIHYGLRWEFLN